MPRLSTARRASWRWELCLLSLDSTVIIWRELLCRDAWFYCETSSQLAQSSCSVLCQRTCGARSPEKLPAACAEQGEGCFHPKCTQTASSQQELRAPPPPLQRCLEGKSPAHLTSTPDLGIFLSNPLNAGPIWWSSKKNQWFVTEC